ncbi:1111_t:CDS:2 [Racocetra fulgida]|uniref:1111_t:CDS:1 n=1 Tax=Racocetra fulgida TaxID=60492 RepID=A0A9N8Z8H9_9GLOM|nr:1111_t:CDS:2 [Racocetra fulgida]
MSSSFTDTTVDTSIPVVDEWIKSSDGVEIYTRTWKAVSDKPIATVVFVHGFGEHIKRYNHVFDKFGKENIEVYAYDQRGFGETAIRNKNPGKTGGRNIVLADIAEALSSRRKEGIPQFLMAGLICSSPLLQTTPKAKSITDNISLFALPIASKLMPNVTWNADINTNYISRDPVEVKKYIEDPLIHSMDINIPIYIAHGAEDMITDPNASKLLIEKTKSRDKTFHEWDSRYHEMHNDYGNTEVIKGFIQWILKHVKS